MKNFHNAESLKEKLSITNSFEDERYRDFAIRICAQEFPADIDIKYLQHCKNLVKHDLPILVLGLIQTITLKKEIVF